jgi:hypothetical protein
LATGHLAEGLFRKTTTHGVDAPKSKEGMLAFRRDWIVLAA